MDARATEPTATLDPIPSTPATVVFFGNIRGLVSSNDNMYEFNMIRDIAYEKSCFLICITESHLNKFISHNESEIEGFDQVRCDRKNRMGGGVICYVRDYIPITNNHTLMDTVN